METIITARVGMDASTMEANAALRPIVRREDGRTYREVLTQMAQESGIETPSVDTTPIAGTLTAAEQNLAQVNAAPTTDKPGELVADKGYHARAVLKALAGGAWKTRIAKPKQKGFSRWHGDGRARAAVYANRTRLESGIGKLAMRRRAEIVERSFAHNLGILMRLLIGAGTPKEAAAQALACLFLVYSDEAVAIILLAGSPDAVAILVMAIPADPG